VTWGSGWRARSALPSSENGEQTAGVCDRIEGVCDRIEGVCDREGIGVVGCDDMDADLMWVEPYRESGEVEEGPYVAEGVGDVDSGRVGD